MASNVAEWSDAAAAGEVGGRDSGLARVVVSRGVRVAEGEAGGAERAGGWKSVRSIRGSLRMQDAEKAAAQRARFEG